MNNKNDYTACMEVFMSIPHKEVKTPNIPVDVFLQEAENLYQWCLPDKSLLLAAGLSDDFIYTLPARANACRTAQALWERARNSLGDINKQWEQNSADAYQLRDQLIHSFRYAFRNHKQLLTATAEIAGGNTDANMIQNLNDLAVLGKYNIQLLNKINFDNSQLNMAADMANELAGLLAAANSEKAQKAEIKEIRDRAYTYLKLAVDEIRNCGKYALWKNPERLKGYTSAYRRKNG